MTNHVSTLNRPCTNFFKKQKQKQPPPVTHSTKLPTQKAKLTLDIRSSVLPRSKSDLEWGKPLDLPRMHTFHVMTTDPNSQPTAKA
jgi:hypothetical protein